MASKGTDSSAKFPVLQEIEGDWTSTKTVAIMGLRIPAYFTKDPQALHDYITNLKTKSDDVFVVSYPKSGKKMFVAVCAHSLFV